MDVDVQIYISEFKRFFNLNTEDLANLVPVTLKDDFYRMVANAAQKNLEEDKEIPLTQKQLIEICVVINGGSKKKIDISIIDSEYGKIFLN